MNIGYLGSGKLGYSTLSACDGYFTPSFIATDSNSEEIIKYAGQKNIPLFKGNPRGGRLKDFMKGKQTDVLLSVNYLFLIEQDVIDLAKYPVNFHGSLLPLYRGRTPHVWAIINNENKTGVTAHVINSKCDEGDVILQKEVAILPDDTGATILAKFEPIYPAMIKEILTDIKNGKLKTTPQDHSKATFFGKRTPDDGEINWSWQREKIRNWVRAQANPYPGAFTFLGKEKIIIDEVSFIDLHYNESDPNGLIISGNPDNIIKTPNGTVKLKTVRTNSNLLQQNKILGNENR